MMDIIGQRTRFPILSLYKVDATNIDLKEEGTENENSSLLLLNDQTTSQDQDSDGDIGAMQKNVTLHICVRHLHNPLDFVSAFYSFVFCFVS
jgi:hypothetical protein